MAHLIRFITQFRTHTFTFLETDFRFGSNFGSNWFVFDFGFLA